MGQLYYGALPHPTDIPDRLLAHLKVVIVVKFRRNESFMLNWRHGVDEPGGRSSIWLQPSIPTRFVFESPEPEILDTQLLRELTDMANSTGGITIALDPVPLAVAA